ERIASLEPLGAWGYRLFALLLLVLTLANGIAPDNAFAKGAHGLGHASMSRGYSHFGGFHAEHGLASRATGSLGGERGFGGFFRNGRPGSARSVEESGAGHSSVSS